jgi:hypothetical protein
MRKKTSTILAAFVALAFVVSAGLVLFTERGSAQVTTRWNLCRVLGAGYDGCGLDMEGLDNVTATGTITAGYFVGDGGGLTGISGLLTEHVVYVADNGNDTTGNGSEFNPVQSLTKALTLVPGTSDSLIVVGHGTFSADGLVFDDVSIEGTGSTIISGSFELRGDASVSGATLTGIISTYEDNSFNRVYLANGRLVVKTGAAFRGQQVYTLSADAGYIPITVEAGASLTINYSEIKTASGITPVQSAGSIEISNSSIEVAVGTEGGNSLSLSSTGGFVKLSNVAVYGARHTGINIENSATSAAPNVLNNVVSNKDIVAGTAYTYYEGLVFTDTATITGSELHNTYIGDLAVSGLITASGNIESTSGDIIAFDDFIVGDDVWIKPGGRLNFDYPTGTEYFTWNGSEIYTPSPIDTDDDITTSGGVGGGGCIITAVGEIECFSHILTTTGDIEATTGVVTAAGFETAGTATASQFVGGGAGLTGVTGTDSTKVLKAGDTMSGALTVNHDITATGTITGGGFTTAGNATAAYFIGDGSLLINVPAGTGDFMADGSVAMTGDLDMGGNSIINVATASIVFVGGASISYDTASSTVVFSSAGEDPATVYHATITPTITYENEGSGDGFFYGNFAALSFLGESFIDDLGGGPTYSFVENELIDLSGGYGVRIAPDDGMKKLTYNDEIEPEYNLLDGINDVDAILLYADLSPLIPDTLRHMTILVTADKVDDTADSLATQLDGFGVLDYDIYKVASLFEAAGATSNYTLSESALSDTYEWNGVSWDSLAGGNLGGRFGALEADTLTVGGEAGIDTTWTVCCTWDSFTCTATGTVTVTKGAITGEPCP